jgi:hypothetical protein
MSVYAARETSQLQSVCIKFDYSKRNYDTSSLTINIHMNCIYEYTCLPLLQLL